MPNKLTQSERTAIQAAMRRVLATPKAQRALANQGVSNSLVTRALPAKIAQRAQLESTKNATK